MPIEINLTRVIDNILYVIKKESLKIGDVESKSGVSTGYISRLSKENIKPGIDFIMSVSDVLNISIDSLLKDDLSRITPTEEYYINFIKKLIDKVKSGDSIWEKETKTSLNTVDWDSYGCGHPLFEVVKIESFYKAIFKSKAYEENTGIFNDCYKLNIYGPNLYLMSVFDKENSADDSTLELWLYNDGEKQFLCSDKNKVLSDYINSLYRSIIESEKYPKIDPVTKDILDSYINDYMPF